MDQQVFDQAYQGQAPWDTKQEIRDSFYDGWKIQRIEATRFEALERPDGPGSTPGGPKAWLATIERT